MSNGVAPGARVVVTGGRSHIGPSFIAHLQAAGYRVSSVDLKPWAEQEAPCPHLQVDLRELGQVVEVLHGADAVVHLAAVHNSRVWSPSATFDANMQTTFNVFQAAHLAGLKRVVMASSLAVMGDPFGDRFQPARLPLLETDRPQCLTTYTLSKVLAEYASEERNLWPGVTFVNLRFGYMLNPEDYPKFVKEWHPIPDVRKKNLWNYTDMRDAAQACDLALRADVEKSETFFIGAADTIMDIPTRKLVADHFPGTELAPDTPEFGACFSIAKAERLLGYRAVHSWRDAV